VLGQQRARAAGLATGLAWGTVIVAVAGLRLLVPPAALVPALAGSVSLGMAVGAVLGWAALHRDGVGVGLLRPLLVGLVAAVVAVLACWWPAARLADAGLPAALLGGVGVALLGTAVFAGATALLDRSLLTGLGRLRGRAAETEEVPGARR
jgi:putative peptidoglycan lipid II flippase